MREHGAEALAFDSIVAAGVNGSRPHADPATCRSRRERSSRSTWDASSTAIAPTARGRSRPAISRRSSKRPTASSRRRSWTASRRFAPAPSAPTSTQPRASAIAEAGLADAYGHGLGHGVGLDIHEAPNLRPESTDTLAAGNVVTVEPGLYLPGVGGCRIEDLVAVTEDGCEIISSFTKEMLVVA